MRRGGTKKVCQRFRHVLRRAAEDRHCGTTIVGPPWSVFPLSHQLFRKAKEEIKCVLVGIFSRSWGRATRVIKVPLKMPTTPVKALSFSCRWKSKCLRIPPKTNGFDSWVLLMCRFNSLFLLPFCDYFLFPIFILYVLISKYWFLIFETNYISPCLYHYFYIIIIYFDYCSGFLLYSLCFITKEKEENKKESKEKEYF